jgi:hypothetical protein
MSQYVTSLYVPSHMIHHRTLYPSVFTSPYVSSLKCGVHFVSEKAHCHGMCVRSAVEFIDRANFLVPAFFQIYNGRNGISTQMARMVTLSAG